MKSAFKDKFDIRKHFLSVQPDLDRIDSKLRQQIQAFEPSIAGYVEYAIENGGKRIRPALVVLSGKASGGAREEHLDLAVILELVHLATLVHDDILDHATLRRGVPTMKAKWGTEISVLLGDCLFAHALKLCTRFDDLHISRVISSASNEVCSGEIIQTQRRFDLKITVEEYLQTIRMKTGALFRVSTELAAYLNGMKDDDLTAFSGFGDSLGTAYQIYDDCLDLIGEENRVGKTLGTDLARGKLTLPVLHMLRQLSGIELERISEALLQGGNGCQDEITEKIRETGGYAYAARKARELLDQGDRSLGSVQSSKDVILLQDIARSFGGYLSKLAW